MRYIPKIIHLIWFGRNPYSPIVEKCINSWHKYCPDYEIMLWNEDSFDVNSNTFVKEAYESKKWAFVSDYVRLYALINYGGVYIDSDVELLKPIDDILEDRHVVTGYSSSIWIPTGLMASEKDNKWIKGLLNYYSDRHFILPDGTFDMKVNNAIITELSIKQFGFKPGDMKIQYGDVSLFPRDYFHPYPKTSIDFNKVDIEKAYKVFKLTKNSYCIHYGTATWVKNRNSFGYRVKRFVRKCLPECVVNVLERFFFKFHKWNRVK